MKKKSIIIRYTLIITSLIFITVIINVEVIKMGYAIEREYTEIKNLTSSNKYLIKEINTNKSPKTIEYYALQMGLKEPEPYSIVILDEKREENNHQNKIKKFIKKIQEKLTSEKS